jgi:phage terminase small subunit
MPATPAELVSGPTLASNVVAFDGGRAGELSSAPPSDLPEDQKDFWKRCARLAIEAGTLTLQTEASFRLLCELDAEKTAVKKTLDDQGRTYLNVTVDGAGQEHSNLKAHPLTSSYRQLAQRVEALMARFGLAPFGKPVAGTGKKKPTANPWLAIAAGKNGRP